MYSNIGHNLQNLKQGTTKGWETADFNYPKRDIPAPESL